MEALSFLRFWKQTSNVNKEFKSSVFNVNGNKDLDESDDSFFELQLSLPTSNNNNTQSYVTKHHGGDPVVSLSKRKIIPVEPTSNSNLNTKPQPPLSLFKSSPKFRLFSSFKNSKSKNPEVKPSEGVISGPPTLTRVTSIGKTTGSTFHKLNSIDDLSTGEPSKRFSKDAIQKYVKKLNPMQGTKTLRKDNVNPSPTGSPAPVTSLRVEKQGNVSAGIRVARKHVGKTRSGSDGPSPAVSRGRDDSLIMQDDGIQSAILHCKRSFNSSPGL